MGDKAKRLRKILIKKRLERGAKTGGKPRGCSYYINRG